MWMKTSVWCILLVGAVCAQQSNDCPNPQDILPCVCRFPPYLLQCADIYDVEVLKRIALNLEESETDFTQFLIANSSLQYLPKEILDKVKVKELYLQHVTLAKAFQDSPSSKDGFQLVSLDNVKLQRGVIWTVFKNMRNLQTLRMYNISVPVLGKDFKENAPRNIRKFELSLSQTKKLELGVFNDFKNLETIEVREANLETLHRGSFPVPFDVQELLFSYNKLKSIPADLFTKMPKLRSVGLATNQLATIPESAFDGRYNQMRMLTLAENPLKCDCSLKWIVRTKPFWFDGTCASPKALHGKNLNYLKEDDFAC